MPADLVTRVVFALERDAKTDPPACSRDLYITDLGLRVYDSEFGWGRQLVQPSWWYDLRPTEGEPLTVDDLETAHDAAQMLTGSDFHKRDWPRMYRCQDRLRAALDALNTKEDS